MRLDVKLLFVAWLALGLGILSMFLGPSSAARADEPFIVDGNGTISSFGAYSVINNWNNGWQWPNSNTKKVTIVDSYGLPANVKNSQYYPAKDYVWNHDDNPHTWVSEESPQTGGPHINILQDVADVYCGDPPHPCTHIHLWTINQFGQWVQDNDLSDGPTYVGDIHLTAATVNTGPDSAATVLSHEIGHALGLKDETQAHDTIMISPSPGTRKPSWADRRVEEQCIWLWPWTYPCW